MLAGPTQEQVLLLSGAVADPNTHSTKLVRASSMRWEDTTPEVTFRMAGQTVGTIEIWANMDVLPTAGQVFSLMNCWGAGGGTLAHYSTFLYNNAGTYQVRFQLHDGATDQTNYSWDFSPTADTWAHYAFAFDLSRTPTNAEAEFVLNGVNQGAPTVITDGAVAAVNSTTTERVQVGSRTEANYFDGWLDELRVWSDERTTAEINDNKDAHIDTATAGLSHYHKFNNNATDSTGSSDLSGINSPTFDAAEVPFA